MHDENELNWIFSFLKRVQILHSHINNMILDNVMAQMDWKLKDMCLVFFFIF